MACREEIRAGARSSLWPMTIPVWLPSAAATAPDRLALVAPGVSLSYADLEDRSAQAARRLTALGAGPGDRVALTLGPGPAFVEVLHGCLLIGAVAMPVDVRLGEAERAAQTASAALVVDAPLGGPVSGEIAPAGARDADTVAVVVHTSGTTAAPKPVELTYGNWLASTRGTGARLSVGPGDRWLSVLPLAHVGGLSILIRSAIWATTAIVHERFDVERVVAVLQRGEATLVSLVPTMLARLLDAGLRAPPGLRCAVIGGAPLPAELARRARQAGVALAQTYGLTESCSQVTMSEIGDPATAGTPLPGVTVQIAPDGEILLAGPALATASIAADGFLHTGDLGHVDERGRLTVTGRRTDTIVSGGENVAPAEIEAVLLSHPAVADAVVHARPDAEWGEAVVATVVVRAGASVSEPHLREHCARLLAGFKVPKAIGFAERVPRTPSGKVVRRRLT